MNTVISKILLALVIIQALVIMWLVFDKLEQTKITQVIKTELDDSKEEKNKVENKLNNLLLQYESLKTDNKDVNNKLNEEKAKIEKLLTQLKSVKGANRAKIKELEQEAESLREILKTYIRQVDQLNTKNKHLTAENNEIKQQYKEELSQKESAINERDSLNIQINKAATLKAKNITITPLNKRQKSTTRARKVLRYQVCFDIDENVVAKKGEKEFFIRIAGPDNVVLMNKVESGMFSFENKQIAYSSKRKINYQGKVTETCIFWSAEKKQAKGKYLVQIFSEGKQIGRHSFKLK